MAGLPRVLLTGFEPFGGEPINPALEVLHELSGERIAGHRVEPAALPVCFSDGPRALIDAIERVNPSLVVCVGQAGGRARISIERVAINLADARIADNAGAQPIDRTLIKAAPSAYFSTLPVKALHASLNQHGVPAELSLSAGTFVCNAVFFALMHHLATQRPGVRGGFLHIPYLPEQACRHPGAPSMSLATLAKGLGVAIGTALETASDLVVAGGVEC
jgi:pyroglutamyl-peptidase